MRRTAIIASLAMASASIAPMGAQTRPDFSGAWTHVSSVPEGLRALGEDFSIAQNATSMTLETRGVLVGGSVSSTGASSSYTQPYKARMTHALGGNEHPLVTVFDPPLTRARLSADDRQISKAVWAGPQLVVMTYRTVSPSSWRQMVRETFLLGADGALVVDKLIVSEPLRMDREQPMPTPVRSVYKRR